MFLLASAVNHFSVEEFVTGYYDFPAAFTPAEPYAFEGVFRRKDRIDFPDDRQRTEYPAFQSEGRIVVPVATATYGGSPEQIILGNDGLITAVTLAFPIPHRSHMGGKREDFELSEPHVLETVSDQTAAASGMTVNKMGFNHGFFFPTVTAA